MSKLKKETLYYTTIETPVGELLVGSKKVDSVSVVHFIRENKNHNELIHRYFKNNHEIEQCSSSHSYIKKGIDELKNYFKGTIQKFTVECELSGTHFQQNVWNELKNIPYGVVESYGSIAERIGNPKACRAVGMANHNNKIGIIIPCHRVIGKNGSLTGYASGLDKKQWLLEHEQKYSCSK